MFTWFRNLSSKRDRLNQHIDCALRFRSEAEYDQAIRAYDRAIATSASFAPAYYGRGYCYYSKQDYARASRDFDTGIQLDPALEPEYSRYIAKTRLSHNPEETFSRQNVLRAIEEKFSDELREAILNELDTICDHYPFKDNDLLTAQVQLSVIQLARDDGRFIIDGDYQSMDWRDTIVAAGYG